MPFAGARRIRIYKVSQKRRALGRTTPASGQPRPWRAQPMENKMLDANLKGQLKAYMANITQPVQPVPVGS